MIHLNPDSACMKFSSHHWKPLRFPLHFFYQINDFFVAFERKLIECVFLWGKKVEHVLLQPNAIGRTTIMHVNRIIRVLSPAQAFPVSIRQISFVDTLSPLHRLTHA